MIPTTSDIQNMIDRGLALDGNADITNHSNLRDILHAMNALVDVLNGRVGRLEHFESAETVPAQWYRAAIHSSAKVYRELLALGEAVGEFDASEPIRKRQREVLEADSEYQRLLAEEQTPTIWGKGLEDVLEVQRALHPEGPPGIVDYTKPHPFDLGKQTGLPHVEYRICKCGMSETNKTIHPY